MAADRKVQLRREVDGADQRFLDARLNADGDLVIEGQDLGPRTAPVSSDGEYEWTRIIRAGDLPTLLQVLGSPTDADVLDVLQERWTGRASYELERLIRESDVPSELSTWAG